MVYCYAECRKNAEAAVWQYAEKYPQGFFCHTLLCVIRWWEEKGTVAVLPKSRRPCTASSEASSTLILANVAANPHVSSRTTARNLGICKSSVLRVLHSHRFHPYHVHCHQELTVNDRPMRVDFYNRLLVKHDADPNFLSHMIYSDESQFSRDGIVNKHIMHYWADTNPRWLLEGCHQVNWHFSVWCGMYKKNIIGPVFCDGNLTGQRYLDMIINDVLSEFLDELPLSELRRVVSPRCGTHTLVCTGTPSIGWYVSWSVGWTRKWCFIAGKITRSHPHGRFLVGAYQSWSVWHQANFTSRFNVMHYSGPRQHSTYVSQCATNELYLEEVQAFYAQRSMLISDDVDGCHHFSGKRHFNEPKNSLQK